MTADEVGSTVACDAWDNSSCRGTRYCPPRCPRFTDREGVSLLVRPYGDDDREALASMYEDLDDYSHTMGLPPGSRQAIGTWLDGLAERGWNLVVLDGERVVGHVGVAPAEAADPAFVVFVHQDYQNRGVGTELIRQLVAHAADRDHDALQLAVTPGNHRAITVYENVGFDVVERAELEHRMRLSLADPVADRVRLPPAERDGN